MSTELQVRVSDGAIGAAVPGAWNLSVANVLVIDPAARRGPIIRAIGKRIPELTPDERRGDADRLVEVVPFGRDHVEADAAAALLAYFTWRSWTQTRPILLALLGYGTYRYQVWIPWWDVLPPADRAAFVRAMTRAVRLSGLWINDRHLLRQSVVRRFLRLRPISVGRT